MSIRAIIPLKALTDAKGRLSGALDATARQELVARMATHVVDICRACDSIDEVLVVAGDEAAATVGQRAGAEVMVVAEPGLDVALNAADAASTAFTATLVVAADLPDLAVEDLAALIAVAAGAAGPVVVIAPTDDGGTGALLRRPPDAIATAYGPGSARAHLGLAHKAGVAAMTVRRKGLAHDVDTPEHLSGRWLPGGSTS